MGYNIEVSIDIRKNTNLSEIKGNIIDYAFEMNCGHYYYLYEMEGNCKIPRNHCIIVINFDDDHIYDCSKFFKTIKKMSNVHVECIYEDSTVCKLIYASSYYLTKMDKSRVKIYTKFKRERSYSDNESTILL
jgi:hypothetical protein